MSHFDDGDAGYPRLLQQLAGLRSEIDRLVGALDMGDITPPKPDSLEAYKLARAVIKTRIRRQRLFGRGLFGEPAWDMLLALYAAFLERRSESVTSIALASGVPVTTALRSLQLLQDGGWVVRAADPRDGRRSLVSLTAKAKTAMELVLGDCGLARLPQGDEEVPSHDRVQKCRQLNG